MGTHKKKLCDHIDIKYAVSRNHANVSLDRKLNNDASKYV